MREENKTQTLTLRGKYNSETVCPVTEPTVTIVPFSDTTHVLVDIRSLDTHHAIQ